MLKEDEFPTSTSGVAWLSMCTSESENSMNHNPALQHIHPFPQQQQQQLTIGKDSSITTATTSSSIHDNTNRNTTANITLPSYDKMIGGMSTATISNLHNNNPSVSFSIDTIMKHNNNNNNDGSSLTILPSPLTTNKTSGSSSAIPQRKSVDFANLPPPSPKRIRQQIISLASFTTSSTSSSSSFSPNTATAKPKWTIQQIVHGLATCIDSQDRMNVIQEARYAFSHDDPTLHNQEILNEADKALTKQLTYLLYHYNNSNSKNKKENDSIPQESNLTTNKPNSNRNDPNDGVTTNNLLLELSLTCDALESIYRASSEVVAMSFRRLGSELIGLVITVIDQELQKRQQALCSATPSLSTSQHGQQHSLVGDDNRMQIRVESTLTDEEKLDMEDAIYQSISQEGIVTIEGDLLLRKATKVLAHFARVGEATKPMAYFPGLLECLITLISSYPYELVPWEARLSALWILGNLACNADNMIMMVNKVGLVQSLVDVANRPLTPNDTLEMIMEKLRSRSIASRAILNLSWAPENKIQLAGNTSLLDLMTNLCILRVTPNDIGFARNSTTIQSIFDTTRLYAVGAIRNIAAAPRPTKIALCHYRDGHILDVLTDAIWNDADQHVKDRALASVHNLAVHDTAIYIANRPALVLALKDVLLSASNGTTDDTTMGTKTTNDSGRNNNNNININDGTPKQHAHATVLVLQRTITPDMIGYDNVRNLLDAVNEYDNSNTSQDFVESVNIGITAG